MLELIIKRVEGRGREEAARRCRTDGHNKQTTSIGVETPALSE